MYIVRVRAVAALKHVRLTFPVPSPTVNKLGIGNITWCTFLYILQQYAMLRAFRVSRFSKLCNFKFLWTNNIVSNVHLHATQTIKTCITLIAHFCIKLKKDKQMSAVSNF